MATHEHLVRIGKLLQRHRQDKKLSLKEISHQLKIGTQTLKSIEKAEMEKLPSYVYLRGFILSYARIVGLDEQEVLKEIKHLEPDSEETTLSKLPHPEEEEITSVQSKFISAISAVIILFCLAAILVITNFIRSQKVEEEIPTVEESDVLEDENKEQPSSPSLQPEEENEKDTKTEMEDIDASNSSSSQSEDLRNVHTSTASSQPFVSSGGGDSQKNSPSGLEIVVKAIKDVTFLYQLDKGKNEEVSLKKDQFTVLKGANSIWIRTNNSEHIQILQDGQTFGVFGTGGAKEKTFYTKPL